MKPIFLIGYMASGKTTFGDALAKRKNLRFIDLDDYIIEKQGYSINEIFASRGEEGFRKIEKEALLEVAQMEDTVIACGGGTPCFYDNMDLMNDSGLTVWLKASESVLLNRLIEENEKRPLVAGKTPSEILEIIRKHLSIRLPYYKKAEIKWNGDKLENEEQISKTVTDFISHYL